MEKRNDVGVVKLPLLTQKNDRANNLGEKKEVNDGIYFPEYTAIDKNVRGPLYRAPSNVQPPHLPEGVLFPEHWKFYDGDLNKVRAEVAKNVMIANGLGFNEYQVYAKSINEFKAYL